MRELFADLPEACDNTLVIAQRCAFMPSRARPDPAGLPDAGGDERGGRALRQAGASNGLAARLAALEHDAAATPYRERLDFELGHDRQDGLRRLFPDRRRLHPVGEAAGHSGRAGARFGRRLGRRLGIDHHRSRSVALRLAVRAVSQSRARVDAGLRHRFLPGPARRGDPLRPAEIRPRPGRADHHLRQAAGARGAARCRPRARHAVWPGRPPLQAGAEQPGPPGHARQGDRRRTGAAADARQRRDRGAV